MINVEVEIVFDTSVRVSWDSVDIPEITGYTVYYSQTGNRKRQSEEFITVNSSVTSVVIEGLLNNVEYQFQVVAIAELDGNVIMGQRSNNMTIIVVAIPTSKYDCIIYYLLHYLIHNYSYSNSIWVKQHWSSHWRCTSWHHSCCCHCCGGSGVHNVLH